MGPELDRLLHELRLVSRDRAGNTMVSALVATGISFVGFLATQAMITNSMKAGRRAQGLAEAGVLSDSVRTLLRVNSGAACKDIFSPAVGAGLPLPAAGGKPTVPTISLKALQIPSSTVSAAPVPLISVGDVRGAIKVSGITLTRIAPSHVQLQILTEKQGEQLGAGAIQIPPFDLMANFDSSTADLVDCSYAGSGGNGSQTPASVPQATVKFDTPGTTTWTVPKEVTRIRVKCWGAGGGAGGGGYVGIGTPASGGGGGGGAYATAIVPVTAGTSFPVSVGAGGTGGNSYRNNLGDAGGASALGSLLSCAGGGGGLSANHHVGSFAGGTGGACTAGASGLCLSGASGGMGFQGVMVGGAGGTSPMGGEGGRGASYVQLGSGRYSSLAGEPAQAGFFPGGGGGGAFAATLGTGLVQGASGANGLILIEY